MCGYSLPSLQDVEDAADLISPDVVKTPVKFSNPLSDIVTATLQQAVEGDATVSGVDLLFKCENLQRTGSFKFRGASHFLAKSEARDLEKGVVAYSTGNHALAVAHAARIASSKRNIPVPTHVVVPSNCSPVKVDAAKRSGASVLFAGLSHDAKFQVAQKIQHSTGAILIPPADHANIVLGQATAVLEFLRQAAALGRSLDAIVVPSGGGGLLVGAIAVCVPLGIKVFGAEPAVGGAGLCAALERGRRAARVQNATTVAEGLRSVTGEHNWEHISAPGNVDGVFAASEQQIKRALRVGIESLGCVIEPSAAVPLAVALFNTEFLRRIAALERRVSVGIVLTGGNVSGEHLCRLVPGLDLELIERQ